MPTLRPFFTRSSNDRPDASRKTVAEREPLLPYPKPSLTCRDEEKEARNCEQDACNDPPGCGEFNGSL